MTIKITFLGTADAVPSASRNHTAILLTYQGENILIDCGEGTQRQFRKAKLNPCKLTKLLITHWHGDHVLGIPGLLQTLALSGYKKTFHIYGPRGTKRFMEKMFETFVFSGKLSYNVEEIEEGKFFETKDFYLEAKKMSHSTFCYAYSFVKKGAIRIDKVKLKKSKLPLGPLLQKLKKGEDIIHDGKRYLAKNLTFREKDKKISFVLDTNMNERIAPFVENSDLLICESSLSDELKEQAKEYKHLTAKQVGEIAKKSKAKKLILTHISQRYDKEPEKILKEARKIFKNAILVKDLDVLEV